jgi:SP family xylose:H+ symportor-like MFS transporter
MMEFSSGGTYLFYGVMSIISAIFVWKMIPETKGKTLEEMENLWDK